jgi:hypothetical protein
MGRSGFDLSIAELGRQRVEISRAAGADYLDGLPPRRTTPLVYLSRLSGGHIAGVELRFFRCWNAEKAWPMKVSKNPASAVLEGAEDPDAIGRVPQSWSNVSEQAERDALADVRCSLCSRRR